MRALALAVLAAMIVLAPVRAGAQTTVVYRFDTEHTTAGRPPIVGHAVVTSTIDGPTFRNRSNLGAIELSEDDGRTTYFGALHTTPQTPLLRSVPRLSDPIAGTVEDETLTIGASTPGPALFGVPTRVYTVDYTYTIVARVLVAIRMKTVNHARFTFTVADIDVSNAALRVAFSRGYGYALCLHGEAFSGLPLLIEGTIESPYNLARVHVRAESLAR